MPGGREIYSEWSLIYQLSPGYILLCGHSELIMLRPGDGRVISRVLMVRARVCHWLMTIKSPLIWADHCWLLSFSALTLAVQCPVRECGARSRLEPGPAPAAASTGQPGQEPPVLSLLTLATDSGVHTPHSTHEPQPMKFSGLPTPAQQPATPATILDRTGCRERWVGRQLGQRKLASIVTKLQRFKHICFIILLKQSPFEFNLSNHRFPINFSLQESTTNNASETITYNLTRLLI